MENNSIISIDVGIKNLGICILLLTDNQTKYSIQYWESIDLLDCQKNQHNCSQLFKSGTKKNNVCGKKALFKKDNNLFCGSHFPNKNSPEEKKKHKIKLKSNKIVNLSTQNLTIALFKKLDSLKTAGIFNGQKVLIELQPSVNPKMKLISHLIYGYFIHSCVIDNTSPIKNVLFVNAKKKLTAYKGPIIECNIKNPYLKRKKLGIEYCKKMINNTWLDFFEKHKKKDDLADSFLQCVWYIQTNYSP